MIQEFINFLVDRGLSPNEFYLLLCINSKQEAKLIQTRLELRILKNLELIDDNNKINDNGLALIDLVNQTFNIQKASEIKAKLGPDFIHNVLIYRELFPKIKLPSGVYARVSDKELIPRFQWFFNNYNYTWEQILAATKKYVENHAPGYEGMRNSRYFIRKEDKYGSNLISDLATECDNLDNEENKRLVEDMEAKVIDWMKRQNDSFLDNWLKEVNNE